MTTILSYDNSSNLEPFRLDPWDGVSEPEHWTFNDISTCLIDLVANNPEVFHTAVGGVKVPKWIIKRLAEAFDQHRKDSRKSLDELLRVPTDRRNELGYEEFTQSVHKLRFLFRLTQNKAVEYAYKLAVHYKTTKGYFPDVTGNKDSLLQHYRRNGKNSYDDWVENWGRKHSLEEKDTAIQEILSAINEIDTNIARALSVISNKR